MSNSMQSLVQCGTKVWLDSIDPKEVERNRAWGATGATSNPIIISDLLNTGRFDTEMVRLFRDGPNDEPVSWSRTARSSSQAPKLFLPVHEVQTGKDGGQGGIGKAKSIWKMNEDFWKAEKLPLQQEIIFASRGTKKTGDIPWKYVEAFAGADIETNPPATNDAVIKSGIDFKRHID